MKRILLLSILLTAMGAGAQTTTVTGTIKDVSGTPVASGYIQFTLQPPLGATIGGVALFTPEAVQCAISNGSIFGASGSGSCQVQMNTAMTGPEMNGQTSTSTYYSVQFCPYNACLAAITWYAYLPTQDVSTMVVTPATAPSNPVSSGVVSFQSISGVAYYVSHYSSIQAAINAAEGSGQVTGSVIDDRTAAYAGAGFNVPDSVTVQLAPVTYTINATVTFNNGNNVVTAGIILQPGARLLGASTSSNHGTVVQPANGLNADLIATSTVGTGTTTPQWWHWGEIGNLRLVGNGANQTAGDCVKIENIGETARVHDIELSGCYANNIEFIGDSASQSAVSNITSNQATTGSGVAFTNLSGVAVLTGLSGDCNQTALINANFNAAGTLNITGLKAEAETSVCASGVQDPVILTSQTANTVESSVNVAGGYAFGTSQQNFLKNAGPGSIQFTEQNFYLTGYVNILDDTVRTTLVVNLASTTKQPLNYLSNGIWFGDQAFSFLPNTFMQALSGTTPTEIFGAGSDNSTDIAAMGNGDNTAYFTGGLKFGTFNTTLFGQTPGYEARMGWRWTNPSYDETTWTFIPIWASGDTTHRWIGDPNQRWPEIYATDLNSTTATIGTLNVTSCVGCGASGWNYVNMGAGLTVPSTAFSGAGRQGTWYDYLGSLGSTLILPNVMPTTGGCIAVTNDGLSGALVSVSGNGFYFDDTLDGTVTLSPGERAQICAEGAFYSTFGETSHMSFPAAQIGAGTVPTGVQIPYSQVTAAPNLAAPPPIGNTTPNTGQFTSLQAAGPISSTNTSGASGMNGSFGPAPAGGTNDLPACAAGVWNVWGGSDTNSIHWCANSSTVQTLGQNMHLIAGTMAGPASSITGSGSYQTLFSFSIPAGTFAIGSGMKCSARWVHNTGGSDAILIQWALGGTAYSAQTVTSGSSATSIGRSEIEIYTPASLSAQNAIVLPAQQGGQAPQTGTYNTSAINLSAAATLTFSFNVSSSDAVTPIAGYCQTIR